MFLLTAYAVLPLPASWDDVQTIWPGEITRVETAQGRKTGEFVSATTDRITLRLAGRGDSAFARTEVRRVSVQTRSHRLRNTLIGAGVGAAVGVALYTTLGQWFRSEGAESGGFLVAPIAIGAAVGAVLPTGRMERVYDAKAKRDSRSEVTKEPRSAESPVAFECGH